MSGPDLSAITSARGDAAATTAALRQADVALAEFEAAHTAALGRGEAPALLQASLDAVNRQRAQRDALRSRRDELAAGLSDQASSIVDLFGGPEKAIAALDGVTPMTLLPVRIETRYADRSTLQVRIYPDQIHISAHDDALTEAEVDAGRRYWTARWDRLDDEAVASDAWSRMTAGFRPGRARFVVDAMRPSNAPPDEPAWPDVPRRANGWSVPPTAYALPDRLAVVGYRRAAEGSWTELFRVWAQRSVPDTVAVGPSADTIEQDPATGFPQDPALAWLHDPQAAQQLGLFVTVTDGDLRSGSLADGVDRLVVCGVDWTRTPADSAAQLERLLAAQHAEGDLQFVPAGTPTNNTVSGPSGTPGTDAFYDPARPAPAVGDDSAGRTLARILGLSPAALDTVPHAGLREPRWQSALAEVLWRSGPGYYLAEMLDPIASGAQTDADLREFVTAHLRPGGPVPTLRSGRQPYGILPVVARRRFEADAAESPAEAQVLSVATTLRELVEPLVEQVPHLQAAGSAADVDGLVLSLLQRTAVPWSLNFRGTVGPVPVKAIGVNWQQIAQFQHTWTTLIWSKLQPFAVTRLSELTLDPATHPLDVPLVATAKGGTAYLGEIRALLTDPHGELALRLKEDSEALLEALVAASAVGEIERVAMALMDEMIRALKPALAHRATLPTPDTLRIERSSEVAAPAAVLRSTQSLAQAVVPQVDPNLPVAAVATGQFLAKSADLSRLLGAPTDPHYWMARFSTALTDLAQAPADQLEWAFRGQLDAYSSRIDAWWTALASARLVSHRNARPTGTYLGCWGCVENLHPRGAGSPSIGYVHTPSVAHATTAALLRSARQAHQGPDGEIFDVQITSARTREALAVLGGVGQGQRLAALLGYRVERRLQDAGPLLTRYIWTLRAAHPLRSTESALDEPAQAIAARDVVDGVALLEAWRADRGAVLTGGKVAAGDATAVSAALDEVAGLYDAVSDLLVAEAVHQAAQGNLERAGAALAAHDRQAAAADLDITRTPRPGHTLSQRAGLLLQDDALTPGWTRDVRGMAEPRLDHWLGTLLGPAGSFAVSARLVRADGTTQDLAPIRLDALRLGPISLARSAVRPGQGQPTELESMLALRFAAAVADAGADDRIELLPEGGPDNPGRGLGLLLALLTAAGDVLGAPALTGPDLQASGDSTGPADGARVPPATPDPAELRDRVTAVLDALDDVVLRPGTGLEAATAGADPATLEAALLAAVPFSPTALPQVPAGHPDAAAVLTQQATALLPRLTDLRARASNALAAVPAGDQQAEVDALVAVVRLVLGPEQPVLALFTLADPAPVAASLADQTALTGGDSLAPLAWLHQHALVRPAVDTLATLLLHAEADGAPVHGQLAVVQAPHAPGNRWCALPFADPAMPPAHGTASLVAHTGGTLDATTPFTGVLIDAWTETVPAPVETTALTYHFDAPGSRPPQVILVAVPPARRPGTWSSDLLLETIIEAADLARLRTLTLKELSVLGGFIPAWYLPDSYTRDVPSVPIKMLRDRAYQTGFSTASTIIGKG
jgi:hypothetical protein